jgi:hypothetical protein
MLYPVLIRILYSGFESVTFIQLLFLSTIFVFISGFFWGLITFYQSCRMKNQNYSSFLLSTN